MATIRIVRASIGKLVVQNVGLSGAVQDDSLVPVAVADARIIGYRNLSETVVAFSTVSGADGTWSVVTNGNHNDKFRVVCSKDGAGSDIADQVAGIDQ